MSGIQAIVLVVGVLFFLAVLGKLLSQSFSMQRDAVRVVQGTPGCAPGCDTLLVVTLLILLAAIGLIVANTWVPG